MNDIDDEYRRASAQDPSQPSESTRRNILAHAAELAAQRAAGKDQVSADFRRPAANQSRWRPALVGTLAAAGLAGLLVTPLFLPPRVPKSSETSATVSGKAPPLYAPQTTADLPAAPPVSSESTAPARQSKQVERKIEATGGAATADSRIQYLAAPPASAAPPPRAPPPANTTETADHAITAQSAGTASPAALARQSFAQQGAFAARANTADSARQKSASPPASAAAISPATALMRAGEAGDLARMQALLADPIDINARDNQGRTALMLAILRGQSDAVNLLLSRGADANVADSDGITPLQAAFAGTQPGIAAALQRAGAR